MPQTAKSGRQKNYRKEESGKLHNTGRRASKHESAKTELSQDEKRRVALLWKEGYTNAQISTKLGLIRELVDNFGLFGYKDYLLGEFKQ